MDEVEFQNFALQFIPGPPSLVLALADEFERLYNLGAAAQRERDAAYLEHIASELHWIGIKSHDDKFTWQANALSDAAIHLRAGHSLSDTAPAPA